MYFKFISSMSYLDIILRNFWNYNPFFYLINIYYSNLLRRFIIL